MVTQITPINLIPGTMIPRVNISQYDTGARVLKFQVYNGDSLFTFTNAMTVALVGTKPDGKGFSYEGTIASNMPTFDVTAQMSAVAGKVRAELVVFENGERCGSGNFVIFVEEGALGENTDMSESDYAIINDALEAAFDLDHFYADLQNMVTEAVEDIQVQQGQTVIDPTLTVSGAAADAKATGDMARNFLEALMTETTTEASIASIDDGAGGLPLKRFVGNIQPTQSGTGDPSPDNVRPISGYTGVTVTRTGKNILPNILQNVTRSGITVVRNADGSLTFNGTATADTFFYTSTVNGSIGPTNTGLINIKAGTYTLSGCPVGGTATTYVMRLYEFTLDDEYKNVSHSDTGGGNTFATNDDCKYRVGIRFANGITVSNLTFKPQLEVCDTATEYETPQIVTSPVTFSTAAGTVYGGTLTVNSDGSGTLTVDKTIYSIKSSSSISKSGLTACDIYIIAISSTLVLADDTICDTFKYTNTQNINKVGEAWLGSSVTQLRVGFATYGTTTMAEFRTWLDEHDPQIVVNLATPTTYALSAVQVAQMLQGVNNVWMDANGTVQVTYYANTALYVDKKIAELQALVLENQ